MNSTEAGLVAIQSGDAAKLRALLAEAPELASSRDAGGVSLILQCLYNRHPELAQLLLEKNPQLDVFDASSLGRVDRLRDSLRDDPKLVSSWSADGFAALHLAAFFGQLEAARI